MDPRTNNFFEDGTEYLINFEISEKKGKSESLPKGHDKVLEFSPNLGGQP